MNSPLSDRSASIEARQILRRHGQVGVQNHQDVAGRAPRSRAAPRRPCPWPVCRSKLAGRCGLCGDRRLDRRRRCRRRNGPRRKSTRCPPPISGVRAKMAGMLPASLRAGTTTETRAAARARRRRERPRHDEVREREMAKTPEPDQDAIAERRQRRHRQRTQAPPARRGRRESRSE